MNDTTIEITNDSKTESIWRRYVITPLVEQIKQGVSPEKIAESMAWGAVIGLFPILGVTMPLCGVAAVYLKLNHIAIQVVNWLVYPLQFAVIIPLLKLGNILFGIPPVPLSIHEIARAFETSFFGAMKDYGWMAMRGVIVWIILAIPTAFILSYALRPLMRKLTVTIKNKQAPS